MEHLERGAAAGQPAPETLRRISHDVLDHQGGTLQDDATLLIAEWATGDERSLTASRTRQRARRGTCLPPDGDESPPPLNQLLLQPSKSVP